MELVEIYQRSALAIQNLRLGLRILSACREAGISRAQLRALAGQDPDVAAALAAAEKECNDIMAETMVDPTEWGSFGAQDPKVAAVWSKNVQWLLARVDQATYGDKVVVEQKTSIDHVITHRLEAAKDRILNLGPGDYQDVTPAALPLRHLPK